MYVFPLGICADLSTDNTLISVSTSSLMCTTACHRLRRHVRDSSGVIHSHFGTRPFTTDIKIPNRRTLVHAITTRRDQPTAALALGVRKLAVPWPRATCPRTPSNTPTPDGRYMLGGAQRTPIWTSGPPSAQKLLDPCHPAVRAPLELAPSRGHTRTHPLCPRQDPDLRLQVPEECQGSRTSCARGADRPRGR